MLLVVLFCLELTSYMGGRVLSARGSFYEAPSTEGYSRYLALRDPELGWPPLSGSDPVSSRPSPAFPDHTAKPCVSLYGDSFTFSEEVDDKHAWGDLLARRIGCRVANHGIGGYGTDQALMRFRRNEGERPKVALLGFLTENILRNVNTFRALLSPGTSFSLKPRFVVGDDGELQLVPIAWPTAEEFATLVKEPERYLKHEYFAPGGPSGTSTLSFPFTASLAGLARSFRVRARLRGEPTHAAFFSRDHESRGLLVTAAIAKAFVKESADRGIWGGLVIIPLPADLEYLNEKGVAAHQPLVDELERAGVPFLDTTERYLATLNGKDPCTLYMRCSGGHFNEEGYRLLSEYVYGWLKEQGKL